MQVAATKPSLTFFKPEDVRRLGVDVWTDDDEWDVRGPLSHPHCPHPLFLFIMLTIRVLLFSPLIFLAFAGKLPHRRPDIAHRAPSLGRYRPHRALLRKHTRKDRFGRVRQPSSKSPPLRAQSPLVSSRLATPHPFPHFLAVISKHETKIK